MALKKYLGLKREEFFWGLEEIAQVGDALFFFLRKKIEIGGACGTCERGESCIKCQWGNWKNLDVNGSII
jgi:hypothetical protein